MKKEKIEEILEHYEEMKAEKVPWTNMYQLVGEYVRLRKQNFNTTPTQGDFNTAKVFNTKAVIAARTMASALQGIMWPNAAKTFAIEQPKRVKESVEEKTFFKKQTTIMHEYMDDNKSGLALALNEVLNDAVTFGTVGLGVRTTDNIEEPIKYRAKDMLGLCIDEDSDGNVDTIAWEQQIKYRDLVKMYGEENLPAKCVEDYKDKKKWKEKECVLIFMEPREEEKRTNKGNKSYPIATYIILPKYKALIKESGLIEQDILVSRFYKNTGEKLGRSPAIDAMPDILMVNEINESLDLAAEKLANPPLGIYDDCVLGNDKVDVSAGGVLIVNSQSTRNGDPIFPIQTVGELKAAEFLIGNLEASISQAFFIDMLLDFNNKVRMTLGEAQLRDKFRSQGLNAIFSRLESEIYNPLIATTYNRLLTLGLLGVEEGGPKYKELISKGIEPLVIPLSILQRMKNGESVYEIRYTSPARRMMRSEELSGTTEMLRLAEETIKVLPDARYKVDANKTMTVLSELSGGSPDIMRTDQEAEDLKSQDQQIAIQQMQVEGAGKLAAARRDVALGDQASAIARNTSKE